MRTQRFAATCPRINNNFNKTTKFLHLETPEGISFSEQFPQVQPLTISFHFSVSITKYHLWIPLLQSSK